MKKGDKLYLAHSVSLIKSVRKWEIRMQGKYLIDLINPFKNNTFENVEVLVTLKSEAKMIRYMKQLDFDTCTKIVEYDLGLLRKCDGLVAVFNTPSLGTAQEIFAAHYLYQLPVYVITPSYLYHPWIRYIVEKSGGKSFKTRKAFENYVKELGLVKE